MGTASRPARWHFGGPDVVPRTGLWVRVFVGLLLAVLPPILFLAGTLILTDALLREVDPNVVAVLVVVGAVVWAAILGVVFARTLAEDIRSFRSLAEHGEEMANSELGVAYQQVAGALDERNQQVAAMARETAGIPIDEAPSHVIRALVTAVRSVMRDETWRAAVMRSDESEDLSPGVYLGLSDADEQLPIGDLEQWASVTFQGQAADRLVGPWGAFAVVDASPSERLAAILYAPWEGRGELSPAVRSMLALVGQYAGTALEHSILYARAQRQADELNRLAALQSDFLRGVTHDLQTPLTSIGALATELHANGAIPASARQDLDAISHQADRLRRMVSQLLVASRLGAGAVIPQVEVFALVPLIRRTWSALRANRPMALNVEGPSHLVVADPDRTEQVLWAVLDNAVKYSPEGSPVEVSVVPEDSGLRITICDHGTGLDDSTRSRAFEQFYRSALARKLAPDGSGVGLYAARGLMEAMDGKISLGGDLGSGAVVTLWLPAERSDSIAQEWGGPSYP